MDIETVRGMPLDKGTYLLTWLPNVRTHGSRIQRSYILITDKKEISSIHDIYAVAEKIAAKRQRKNWLLLPKDV